MAQLVRNIADYTCKELPKSREWFRLVNGTVNTLHDFEIDTLFGVTLGPIGRLAKGLDGAYYGKKAIDDFDCVLLSVWRYNPANRKESFFHIFTAVVKCTGDTLATFKWLGTFGGIVILSPYAKSFGYVKNICSVYTASITIITSGSTIYSKYRSTDPDRREKMLGETALVVVSLCSIWLNGMGGLDSYVGAAAFAEKGLQRLQPWTFNTAVIVSNMTSIAKNIAEA